MVQTRVLPSLVVRARRPTLKVDAAGVDVDPVPSVAPDDGGSKRFVLEALPELLFAAGREPTPIELVEETSTLIGGAIWPARDVRRIDRTPQGTGWTLGEVRWPVIGYDHVGNEVYLDEVAVAVALRTAPSSRRGAPHPQVELLRPGTSAVAHATAFTTYESSWVPLDEGTERSAPLWPLLADLAGRLLASGAGQGAPLG